MGLSKLLYDHTLTVFSTTFLMVLKRKYSFISGYKYTLICNLVSLFLLTKKRSF